MAEKKPRKRHVSPSEAPSSPPEASEAPKEAQPPTDPLGCLLGQARSLTVVWLRNTESGEWQTSTWKRWCTECQRYRIYYVTPNAGRKPSYYAAVYLKDGVEHMLYHDRLGPGYPKKYPKMEDAVMDVEKHSNSDKAVPVSKTPETNPIPNESKLGVLGVIRKIVKTGTKVAPVTFTQVVEALKEAFPEREEDALSKSATRFLPDLLGFKVHTKNYCYWVDK